MKRSQKEYLNIMKGVVSRKDYYFCYIHVKLRLVYLLRFLTKHEMVKLLRLYYYIVPGPFKKVFLHRIPWLWNNSSVGSWFKYYIKGV